MGGFCDELRAERERQGLTLEAISWSTKIAQGHLQTLERGEFAHLPGGVFRKGFFKSYLGALRLDPAAWVPRFEAELQAAGVAQSDMSDYRELALNIQRARGIGEPDARLRWSGVVAMLALLLAFGWCVWHFAVKGYVSVAGCRDLPTQGLGTCVRPGLLPMRSGSIQPGSDAVRCIVLPRSGGAA